jgi:hypothetical protein
MKRSWSVKKGEIKEEGMETEPFPAKRKRRQEREKHQR